MIDHLLQFVDEAAAQSALRAYYYDAVNGWKMDICVPGAFTYQVGGDGSKVRSAAYSIWVAAPQLNDQLPGCVLALDRNAAVRGSAFVRFTTLTQVELEALFMQPVNAGTQYLKTVGTRDTLKDTSVAAGEVKAQEQSAAKGA